MPWLFLVAATVGLLFTINAFRPVRRNRWFFGQSFFAAWLTTELAGHHLFWQAVLTVFWISVGSLESWPGWLALALTFVATGCAAHGADPGPDLNARPVRRRTV